MTSAAMDVGPGCLALAVVELASLSFVVPEWIWIALKDLVRLTQAVRVLIMKDEALFDQWPQRPSQERADLLLTRSVSSVDVL